MPSIIRLETPIHLFTPLGYAEAHFLWVPENFEVNCNWGCFQQDTKENWWWPNPQVRIIESVSGSRGDNRSEICLSDEQLSALRPHIDRHPSSPFRDKTD